MLPPFVVLLAALTPYADGPAPVTGDIEAVRRGLSERGASFENLGFRVTIHDRYRALRGEPLRRRTQVIDATIDARERVRIDMVETPGIVRPDDPTKGARLIATSNAEGSREMSLAADGATYVATINKSRGLSWAVNPAQLLQWNYWATLRYLRGVDMSVAGKEAVDGREAVKVDWQLMALPDNPGASRRGTVWVVPSLNHAVVRDEEFTRLTPAGEWRLYQRTVSSVFVDVDGLWLPKKVAYERHSEYSDGEYELGQELVAEFEGWARNRPIDDKTFRLEFPPKTVVRDFTRGGMTYVKGQVDDPGVARQAAKAKGLVDQVSGFPESDLESRYQEASSSDPLDRSRSRLGLAAGVGAVILVVAGAFALRRARGVR